jgi:hypothetical protein
MDMFWIVCRLASLKTEQRGDFGVQLLNLEVHVSHLSADAKDKLPLLLS